MHRKDKKLTKHLQTAAKLTFSFGMKAKEEVSVANIRLLS